MFLSVQFILYFIKEQAFVHRHEIAFDVQFKDITVSGIIMSTRTDKMVYPFNAVMRAFAFAATVAVVNKR